MLRTRLGLAFRHLADGDLAAAQTAASDSQFLTRMTDWGRGRATAAAAAVKEGMVLDGFRLEQKLATGGMSEVYLATQLSLERKAAVKVVSGEAISANDLVGRFTEEARVVGGFTCPYIVPVLAFGTAPLANGTPLRWMAMEYMPSGDLADWLQRHGTPPMDLCVRWLSQALQGLSYAHRHGILHRDLKPHNLLLTADGDLKVTDFGLFKAKRLHDAFGLGRGAVVGTPHYTSPEQATAGEADERSDIFSLGATFFQLCTGRKLFEVEGTAAVLARISQEQAPSLLSVTPSAPRPMATLVDRMTRLAPEDRYQKMDVILADLNSYIDRGLLTSAPPGLLALDFTVDREQNPGASWSPSATTVTTIFRGQNDDEESSSF
jgi:serine/threonine-protein kinase